MKYLEKVFATSLLFAANAASLLLLDQLELAQTPDTEQKPRKELAEKKRVQRQPTIEIIKKSSTIKRFFLSFRRLDASFIAHFNAFLLHPHPKLSTM